MSDYPEHDKQALVVDQAQAAGDFIDWLASQGIHLMRWREDLTDTRPTDPQCPDRRDRDNPRPCDQMHDDGDHSVMYWMRHCLHWQDPEREAADPAVQGECCYCHRGRFYEIHGLKHWVNPGRSLIELLAGWQGIDLKKIEVEKRQILAGLSAARERETRAAHAAEPVREG